MKIYPKIHIFFKVLILFFVVCQVHAQPSTPHNHPANYAEMGLANLPPLKASVECAQLVGTDFSDQVGAQAHVVKAEISQQNGASYCIIRTLIEPHIQSEYRLPLKGWTQRYLQTGCGGLCGRVDIHLEHTEGCIATDNHAVALGTTDMGHASRGMGDGEFGHDPQARIDFAYRGVHLTALLGKAIVQKFYSVPAKYSYFTGCSDGGREALIEAQRFPEDFDGIGAGAPAMNFVIQNSFYHAWQATSNTDASGKTILTADKLPLLHKAVLKACDALDGQVDGIINDPRQCHFDPAVLQCPDHQADQSTCLSAQQVATVKKLYAGPVDSQGKHFTIGGPQYGSELSWEGVFVTKSAAQKVPSTFMALDSIKNLIFEKPTAPDYSINDFQFTSAQFDQIRALHSLYDATNPDLSAFAKKGGKLILWHGWSDPHISPINTIAYYTSVNQLLGKERASSFTRLFLFPGMYHCRMGDGPSEFDLLTSLMRWTENNQAPTTLVAHTMSLPPFKMGELPPKMDGPPPQGLSHDMPLPPMGMKPNKAEKTRLIFAYPTFAVYKGSGNPTDVNNYSPQTTNEPENYDWYGADWMKAVIGK